MSARAKYEYHLKNWSDIQEHLPRLFEAAKGSCLEIGVRGGISTSALLAGVEEHGGQLYSIDINDCREVFRGHPQWSFFWADSKKILDHVEVSPGGEFDLAFIDGDHTYEGALADLRNFGPKAKVILVHDTDAPDYPGVRKAVEQFCADTGRKATYHPGSYGMAEIQ
jgi:hypothetical protein